MFELLLQPRGARRDIHVIDSLIIQLFNLWKYALVYILKINFMVPVWPLCVWEFHCIVLMGIHCDGRWSSSHSGSHSPATGILWSSPQNAQRSLQLRSAAVMTLNTLHTYVTIFLKNFKFQRNFHGWLSKFFSLSIYVRTYVHAYVVDGAYFCRSAETGVEVNLHTHCRTTPEICGTCQHVALISSLCYNTFTSFS